MASCRRCISTTKSRVSSNTTSCWRRFEPKRPSTTLAILASADASNAELRKIGFAANRRLFNVQRIGHDCFIGEAAFPDMQKPVIVGDQRAASLRFADPRGQALLQVLLLLLLVQGKFAHKHLREHFAPLLRKKPGQLTPGRITYDLPAAFARPHRAHPQDPPLITAKGRRIAAFYTRLYNPSLRTGLAMISPDPIDVDRSIAKSIRAAERAINTWYDEENLAA